MPREIEYDPIGRSVTSNEMPIKHNNNKTGVKTKTSEQEVRCQATWSKRDHGNESIGKAREWETEEELE